MTVKHLYRLNNMYPVAIAQLLLSSLANHRIHMDRVNRLAVGMLVKHSANGTEHMMHRLSQVLPPVRGNEDQFAVAHPLQFGMSIILPTVCCIASITVLPVT